LINLKTVVEVQIIDEMGIVEARRVGREAAKSLRFGLVDQARITTAISELARNIYLYARPGKIIIDEMVRNHQQGLKIIAADQGPGIKDIRKALEDGYSTSGGLGAGVPGVKRLMDEFHIESAINVGTTISVIKWIK
jgi:serine/threonine-protein kinase RsbT